MPIETNIICEQCGSYAKKHTYVRLMNVDNRPPQNPKSLVYIVPPATFDVVFCSFKCTKKYLDDIL